jgi:DNA-3-methyladenine glycosylase
MNDFAPLPRSFYERPALTLAPACLGQFLVFERDDGIVAGRIVEAEAYIGPEDRAAHCYGSRRTARNEVMYGPPGFAYVFFIYGMHFHFNIVADAEQFPAAVLIRAVEPLVGESAMSLRRHQPKDRRLLTNGPGKLCQAFGIAREHNGLNLCRPPLYLSQGVPPRRIRRCPRIGVDYAGHWAKRLLRFVDAESAFLSVRPPTRSARTR